MLPILAAVPAAIATAKTVAGWSGAVSLYTYMWFREEPLPEMIDAVDDACQDVLGDAGALVIDSAEQLKQRKENDDELDTRLGGVVTHFGSAVTSLEEREAIPVIPSPESHTETLRCLTEAQTQIGSGVDKQQIDISAISKKLDELLTLRRANQENKALRLRNESLEAKVEALESQLAETSLCLQETKEFAQEQQVELDEQQVEIEALQKQLQAQNLAENKENSPSTVSFFARNS